MKVLIVDDDAATRFLLEDLVSEWDYETIVVSTGEEAWNILQGKDAPRIVLSDWMMPGISGIDLCRKVKERRDHAYVYFILLTSKNQKKDLLAGLDAGADDFLSKPVDPTELRSRLAVGNRTVDFDEQIRRYASQMETLAEERAKQLIHSERLATLGTLAAGVAHEIGNALTLVTGNIDLFEVFSNDIQDLLRDYPGNDDEKIERSKELLEDMPEMLNGMLRGSSHLREIVKGLKSFSRKDLGEYIDCSIHDCITEAFLICDNNLKYRVKTKKTLCENLPMVKAIPQQLGQVLTNLLLNAADAMGSGGGELHVRTESQEGGVRIVVEDEGPGIPEDKLESIWEAFFTTKGREKGTGLGLAISKGIIEDHGGTIIAENRKEGGARFIITLPLEGPKKDI